MPDRFFHTMEDSDTVGRDGGATVLTGRGIGVVSADSDLDFWSRKLFVDGVGVSDDVVLSDGTDKFRFDDDVVDDDAVVFWLLSCVLPSPPPPTTLCE